MCGGATQTSKFALTEKQERVQIYENNWVRWIAWLVRTDKRREGEMRVDVEVLECKRLVRRVQYISIETS